MERRDLYAAAASGAELDAFCYEPEPEASDEQIFEAISSTFVSIHDTTGYAS